MVFNGFEMKWQDQQVLGGSITCLSAGRPVPWEVTHTICTGAWQNNCNGLWKKGPGSAQGLGIHLA